MLASSLRQRFQENDVSLDALLQGIMSKVRFPLVIELQEKKINLRMRILWQGWHAVKS